MLYTTALYNLSCIHDMMDSDVFCPTLSDPQGMLWEDSPLFFS